jgi:8-oxo-dGTP pyrophosphatase MutT (NUDIX family)
MHEERTMITIKQNSARFTYRVAAIAIHNGSILFEHAPNRDFYHPPGGRAELGETAAESLTREMREELGIDITIVRLLYVVEQFFTHNNVAHQTLGLYFLVTFPADAYLYTETGPFTRVEEEDWHLTFAWLPIAELERFPIVPSFLRSGLQHIPEQTMHIVHTDE